MSVRFLVAGDKAVSVEFGSEISLELNAKVRMLPEGIAGQSFRRDYGNRTYIFFADRTLPAGNSSLS